jgi:AcrR family transcriptional regulator
MTDSQSNRRGATETHEEGSKKSKTRTTLSKEDRRKELLDVARTLFLEHGYASTSVSAIVAAAGVAQGTFYLYFKSKQTVLAHLRGEVLKAYRAAWDEAVEAASTDGKPADARLVDGLSAVRDAVYDNRQLVRLFREATAPMEQQQVWLAGRARMSEPLCALLEEGQREGCFELDEPSMAAALALALLDDLLFEAIEFDSPAPLPITFAHGTRFMLRAFRCHEDRVRELVPLPPAK